MSFKTIMKMFSEYLSAMQGPKTGVVVVILTFLSRWRSILVRASVSPPGHTADGRPSVSKPEKQTPGSTSCFITVVHSQIENCRMTQQSISVFTSLSAGVCVSVRFLTQLLQGRDPVLVSVVLRDGGDASTHQALRQRLHGHLGRIQSTDQSLETLVGERRLPAVQLYDPGEGRRHGRVKF